MSGLSVLIVDDDTEFRNSLNFDLARLGYRVSAASGGKKAFELFPKMKFDIVVANVEMPDGNGRELLKQLHDGNIFVPVIFLTKNASVKEGDVQRDGAFGLLRKPCRSTDVAEKIAKALPGKQEVVMPAGANVQIAAPGDFAYFLNIRRALVIVSWTGELRPKDLEKIQCCINETTLTRAKFIIFNFHGFTGYDAVLANEIVNVQKKIRDMPAWLILAGLETKVREKLSSNGLVKDGDIVPSLKDALQYAISSGLAS